VSAAQGSLSPGDLAVDRELADIALGYRFLLDLTPVDLTDARRRFLDDGEPPDFRYRPLEDDITVVANRLDKLTAEPVGDATLAHLVQAKQREVGLQLEMLRCRGSAAFLPLSIELYGAVTPSLLTTAEQLLDQVDPAPVAAAAAGQSLDAATFAQRAQAELDHYRRTFPDLDVRVEIRDDIAGVMFTHGQLLIASTTTVPTARVEALLQHEVGTHVVTYVNGSRQPLRLLAAGLAGYDETQEGLAVLAEHLVGGLTAGRLRQLAARVVAVHQMVDGAAFADVHQLLVQAGLRPEPAFSVTARVFRSGGLTKDAIYLRGLTDILTHLGTPGDLDVLWLGTATNHPTSTR
jgi:uncharacterized protein (TIGR02421 family)